jgi:hypothetical protein
MEVRCSLPLSEQFATGPKYSLHSPPQKVTSIPVNFNIILHVCLNNLSGFLPSPAVLHACYISGAPSLLLQRYYKSCSNILAYGFLSLQLHKKVKQCRYRPEGAQKVLGS